VFSASLTDVVISGVTKVTQRVSNILPECAGSRSDILVPTLQKGLSPTAADCTSVPHRHYA